MARALINVPSPVKEGDIIEIKALISHAMETGYRTGADGALVPRDIIQRFVCLYDGAEVFSADLFPAIAANPYFAFSAVATRSGVLSFSWVDNAGRVQVQLANIVVQPR